MSVKLKVPRPNLKIKAPEVPDTASTSGASGASGTASTSGNAGTLGTPGTLVVKPHVVIDWPIVDLREEHLKNQESSNRNTQLTGYLQKVVAHIKAEGTLTQDPKKKKNNPFRIRSIQKAIDILINHPVAIQSGKEAQSLPGIGAGIGKRIDEILKTGKLSELETIEDDYVRLICELTNISGIGLVKAKKLIETHQIISVDDLIQKYQAGQIVLGKNQLTHHQVIGLKYTKEIDQKIPRSEIDQFSVRLKNEINKFDPELIFEICGSYRRGKAISGDIDVLVSRKPNSGDGLAPIDQAIHVGDQKQKVTNSPLIKLVEAFTASGLIVDHLTESGQTKYMGICRLNPDSVARRIDIRFIPYQNWGAARLYFTGSGEFNKLFRAVALQRGFTVSEYAISPFVNGQKGDPIPTVSEEDIFKLVGVKYLTPIEREF